ncbi:hypothetical protein P171DRAFT_468703 [Karstenula rhodostoma CBS 690.94]|uniref:Uncharacterized protein n=1 Tax=Karstenula rhodostoma CBS 690.94 TaxID=1392251 RepID=A0A9P4PW57_9PLEO|nr:hypothetical protein P171DRAFT_468703 [Karstenula rhodostoma CBS 690.94]
MRVFTLLALVLSPLLFATASSVANEPVTSPTDTDANTAEINGGLYACEGYNFTGNCFWNPPERMRSCVLLLIGKPSNGFGYKPRSLGPDRGGHCDVFKGLICNEQTLVKRIDWPGVKNAAELSPASWDSIRCYATAARAPVHDEIAVKLVV